MQNCAWAGRRKPKMSAALAKRIKKRTKQESRSFWPPPLPSREKHRGYTKVHIPHLDWSFIFSSWALPICLIWLVMIKLVSLTPSWLQYWAGLPTPRSCHNKEAVVSGRRKYWTPTPQRSSGKRGSAHQPSAFPRSSKTCTSSSSSYLLAKSSWLMSLHLTSPILSWPVSTKCP